MLQNFEIENMFGHHAIKREGRSLIRRIREGQPVRNVQNSMDCVRVRYVSKKMERALYAESRTVEFPVMFLREHDKGTHEIWTQPHTFDLKVEGVRGGVTRVQHTPDFLFVDEDGFVFEEWREEARLQRLAERHPERFYKDANGCWHYIQLEKLCDELGIRYLLRSAEEIPRRFFANAQILEDYTSADTPPIAPEVRRKLQLIMREKTRASHLELINAHGFSADDIFKAIVEGFIFVDLNEVLLKDAQDLVLYESKAVSDAEAILKRQPTRCTPSGKLELATGVKFVYQDEPYEIVLPGTTEVIVRNNVGATMVLELSLVHRLFSEMKISSVGGSGEDEEFKLQELPKGPRLADAIRRFEALQNPAASGVSERTLRFWRSRTSGFEAAQDQLIALAMEKPGNTTSRLPPMVIEIAEAAAKLHNSAKKPTISATFSNYVSMCAERGVRPMGRSSFYAWLKKVEDVEARDGKRKAYQKAPIPLVYDYENPVHGVMGHDICYCDHTILNIFCRGMELPDLGKPTLTLMTDGALSKARAFHISYSPAGTASVLMCLRDYVRRHGRLPKTLVLDNGKEFHSATIKAFCSIFGIAIRWRRRSRPRDSTLVERAIGVTEQELIQQMNGNSIALKDPRMVSSSHHPDKHIEWTLPALHGAFDHFLFVVQSKRIHPRFGVSPDEKEKQLILEMGARSHVMVRYDTTFKLLTSAHQGKPMRKVDRQRGVWMDGRWYWNEELAMAKPREEAEVRVERWNASVVYTCFRGQWLIAQARDGGRLEGRFQREVEVSKREENRRKKALAQQDKSSEWHSIERAKLWIPENWDARLREQQAEEYWLNKRLGMAEAFEEAENVKGEVLHLGLHKGSDVNLLNAIALEPDVQDVETKDEKLDDLRAPLTTILDEGSPQINENDTYF